MRGEQDVISANQGFAGGVDVPREFKDDFLKFNMECSSSNSKLDFYDRVYPVLQNLVPHAMFNGFLSTQYDKHFHLCLDAGYGSHKSWHQSSINALSSSLFEHWKKVVKPLVIDDLTVLPALPKDWGRHFSRAGRQTVQSIACHGQSDISNTSYSYFLFLDVDTERGAKHYEDLLELITPQLHSLFTRIRRCVPKYHLSDRETEILCWIAKGRSNKEIADILNISVWTIQSHIKNLMLKLEVGKRSHAVAKAQSYGLINAIH